MKKLIFFLFSIILFFPDSLFSQPLSPKFSLLLTILKNKENFEKQDFKNLGKFANSLLVDVCLNKDIDETIRLKAIKALSLFPTKRTRIVLIEIINSRDFSSIFKETALLSLAVGFQTKAINDIKNYLMSSDSGMRRAAILSAGEIISKKTIEILEGTLPYEKDFDLRLLIEKAIKNVEKKLEENEK